MTRGSLGGIRQEFPAGTRPAPDSGDPIRHSSGSSMRPVPLLVIDGSNLLFRAWFGFPARIRSRDKTRDLTGVFGFFALLRVAVRDEITTHPEITVVFDGELGSAARRETDPAYLQGPPPRRRGRAGPDQGAPRRQARP
jgi:5'-3' exonuclease